MKHLFKRLKRRTNKENAATRAEAAAGAAGGGVVDKKLGFLGPNILSAVRRAPNGRLDGVCFTSARLLQDLRQYPEVIQMDGSHGVIVNELMLFHIFVTNAEGLGQPAFFAFLRYEVDDIITWAIDIFKYWMTPEFVAKIRTVVVDKNAKMRRAWEMELEGMDVPMIYCLVQVNRLFEARLDAFPARYKMGAMTFLRRCMTSTTHASYEIARRQFLPKYPEVAHYFDSKWFHCDQMWAGYARQDIVTFGDKCPNRVEAANRYIDSCVIARVDLRGTIRKIIDFCEASADECVFAINRDMISRPTYHGLEKYQPYLDKLTCYASDKLVQELQENGSVAISQSLDSCDCRYFMRELGPCRHIMNRAVMYKCPPDEVFPSSRWRMPDKPISPQIASIKELQEGPRPNLPFLNGHSRSSLVPIGLGKRRKQDFTGVANTDEDITFCEETDNEPSTNTSASSS